ncbi:MAG: 30S ribosomal protein THX [Bacteroidales bacterium]|nr:30S ribosomal protein THX [Lentimicrobiaceae bacterium]MDD5693879.1 30S ribosomal protein THX [Bacteroidales bacterium]
MGKGDKKSKRGKITIGSYGVRRARKKKRTSPRIVSAPKEKEVKKVPVVEEPIVIEPVMVVPEPMAEVTIEEVPVAVEKPEKQVKKEPVRKTVKEKAPAKKVVRKAKPATKEKDKAEPEKTAEA